MTIAKSGFNWLLVAFLYPALAIQGGAGILTNGPVLEVVVSAFVASACASWVVADARQRQRPVVASCAFTIVVCWPLAIPAYLVWSRGVAGFGWMLLHLIGLVSAQIAGFYLTAIFLYAAQS